MKGSKQLTREEARRVTCDGCGNRESTARYPDRSGEVLCPECARMYQLGRAAELHLSSLIEEVVPAWVEHWLAAGTSPVYVRDILTDLSAVLAGDGADGRRLGDRVAGIIATAEAAWLSERALARAEGNAGSAQPS